MNKEAVEIELQKCKDSLYYFLTKYCTVNGKPFTTRLTEEEYNENIKQIERAGPFRRGRGRR